MTMVMMREVGVDVSRQHRPLVPRNLFLRAMIARGSSHENRKRLRQLTYEIIDSKASAHLLEKQVIAMIEILSSAALQTTELYRDRSQGGSCTSSGLALSPQSAATCAGDFVRTVQFLRGLHCAIIEKESRVPKRGVRILYAGCGPLAALAVPLMSVLSNSIATFTLLDIHRQSIESAKRIVSRLGLLNSVKEFEAIDACCYQLDPEFPPDIILTETMQACLESEPQVAITRHLLGQAPQAVLIPEEVRIDLRTVDVSREFASSLSPQERNLQCGRINIGTVFALSRDAVLAWRDQNHISSTMIRIPHTIKRDYEPMLFTRIRVYGDHALDPYDSGLTIPRPPLSCNSLRRGDTVRFRYLEGRQPRLIAEAVGQSLNEYD